MRAHVSGMSFRLRRCLSGQGQAEVQGGSALFGGERVRSRCELEADGGAARFFPSLFQILHCFFRFVVFSSSQFFPAGSRRCPRCCGWDSAKLRERNSGSTRQAASRWFHSWRNRFGEWLSLVEHLVRDQGVGGSNPLSPTIKINNLHSFFGLQKSRCR